MTATTLLTEQTSIWNSQPLSTWKYRDVRFRIFSAEYDDDDELSMGSFQELMSSIINTEKFDGRDVITLVSQIRTLDNAAMPVRAVMIARKWLPEDFDRHSQVQVSIVPNIRSSSIALFGDMNSFFGMILGVAY